MSTTRLSDLDLVNLSNFLLSIKDGHKNDDTFKNVLLSVVRVMDARYTEQSITNEERKSIIEDITYDG